MAVLGDAAARWDQLISRVRSSFNPLAEDWGFSGKKWGRSLRLKHKKRAVLYLTPSAGYFLAGLALGEKAFDAARESDLPRAVVEVIDSSQKFAEGRRVWLGIRSKEDVDSACRLAAIKMANSCFSRGDRAAPSQLFRQNLTRRSAGRRRRMGRGSGP